MNLVHYYGLDPSYASMSESRLNEEYVEHIIPIFTLADLITMCKSINNDDEYTFKIKQTMCNDKDNRRWNVGIFQNGSNDIVVKQSFYHPELIDALHAMVKHNISSKRFKLRFGNGEKKTKLEEGSKWRVEDKYSPWNGMVVTILRYDLWNSYGYSDVYECLPKNRSSVLINGESLVKI